jgi:hypothetical protein
MLWSDDTRDEREIRNEALELHRLHFRRDAQEKRRMNRTSRSVPSRHGITRPRID